MMVSHHVIENQEISLKKFPTELQSIVGLHQILAGNVITCLEPLLNLSMPFQVLKEIFFLGLCLTVTEISIKKVQKQDLKM